MITINNDKVFNLDGAVRGMRNPMNSHDKSDSEWQTQVGFGCSGDDSDACDIQYERVFVIGANDMKLAKSLVKAGSDHRKFMRQIFVSVDITAPLYWWKEFDTYKVGTTANSSSTMHTIHTKHIDLSDFSVDRLNCDIPDCFYDTLDYLNESREKYLETKDKRYWWRIIQTLPSSYNQLRTVTMNYENLVNMYHARKAHKLDEWREFCKWIETLPYSELITGGKDDAVEE